MMDTKEKIKTLREIGKLVMDLRNERGFTSDTEKILTAHIKEALSEQYRLLGLETYSEK